ncbi:MAG: protein kinase [Candidatus Riflebacteria bacterium]|nr:protein kinase [Candidatus Riflebacteria bacterium]
MDPKATSSRAGRAVAALVALLCFTVPGSPAEALELSTGGCFYVKVLDGYCPRRVDLWGLGAGRNPLHLGRYEGKIGQLPPFSLGTFAAGQDLYLWHETVDTASGARDTADIRDSQAYQADLDPRGGYRIEVRGNPGPDQTRPLLVLWVYPARPAASSASGPTGPTLGSVVVNAAGSAGQPQPAPAQGQGSQAKRVDASTRAQTAAVPVGQGNRGWRFPVLELLVATLLVVSFRRSRELAPAGIPLGASDTELLQQASQLERTGRADEAMQVLSYVVSRGTEGPALEATVARLARLALDRGRTAQALQALSGRTFKHLEPGALLDLASELEKRSVLPIARELYAQVAAREPGFRDVASRLAALRSVAPGSADGETPARPPLPPHAHFSARPPEGWTTLPLVIEAVRCDEPYAPDTSGAGVEPAAGPACPSDPGASPAAGAPGRGRPFEMLPATRTVSPGSPSDASPRELQPVAEPRHGHAGRASSDQAAPGGGRSTAPNEVATDSDSEPVETVVWRIRSVATRQAPAAETAGDADAPARLTIPAGSSAPHAPRPSRAGSSEMGGPSLRSSGPPNPLPDPGPGAAICPMSPDQLELLAARLSVAYRQLDLVGSDPTVAVFAAVEKGSGRKVSVHALAPNLARQRGLAPEFIREARAFADLRHASILPAEEPQEGEVVHLVGAPLRGALLPASLARSGGVTIQHAIAMGLHLCEALDYLHQHGVVHGDLRASRICGSHQEGFTVLPPVLGQVSPESLRKVAGQPIERSAYVAPETTSLRAPDYRCDVYSLGVLLYQALVGTTPGQQTGRRGQLEMPSRLVPDLPDTLDGMIARCLHTDPDRRFQDCGMVRHLLTELHARHGSTKSVILDCLASLDELRTGGLPAVRSTLEEALKEAGDRSGSLHRSLSGRLATAFGEALGGRGGVLSTLRHLVKHADLVQDGPEALVKVLGSCQSLHRRLTGLPGLVQPQESTAMQDPASADEQTARLPADLADLADQIERLLAAHTVAFDAVVREASLRHVGAIRTADPETGVRLSGRFADPDKVRQQLGTALDAIVEVALEAGAGSLDVRFQQKASSQKVRLTVVFGGQGLPASQIDRVLEDAPAGGQGAGLDRPGVRDPVERLRGARQIVEAIDGRLFVARREDGDSEVRITLPTNLP